MLRYSFSLTGREIEKLLKKGFKFKNYALLTKNSTFLKYKVTNIEMSHFLNTNKEQLYIVPSFYRKMMKGDVFY